MQSCLVYQRYAEILGIIKFSHNKTLSRMVFDPLVLINSVISIEWYAPVESRLSMTHKDFIKSLLTLDRLFGSHITQDMTKGVQAGPFGTPDRFTTTSQATVNDPQVL